MNWIRIATKMKGDPRLGAIAGACKVRIHEAVGLVCCTLMEFPDHARSGDVASVPDVVLEQWAMWTGKTGLFAQAFRENMCDETGVVRAWEKHNGKALQKAEEDIARKRAARAEREHGAKAARAETEPSARQTTERRENGARKFGGRRQNGEVDETRRKETTSPAAAAAVVSAESPATVPGRVAAAAAASDVHDPEAYAERRAVIRQRFTDERAQLAFDRHCRASQFPDVFLLDLEAASRERPSDGAPGVPWDVIGTVLHELSVKGKRPTEHLVRVFAGPILHPADRPLSGPISGYAQTDAEIEADVLRRIEAGEFLPSELQGVTHG